MFFLADEPTMTDLQEPVYKSEPETLCWSAPAHDSRLTLKDVIALMHQRQGPTVQQEYLQGVRNLQYCSPLEQWSLFGGCGLASHVLAAIGAVWKDMFNIDVKFLHAVVAERAAEKQRHLHREIGHPIMTATVKELEGTLVNNLVDEDGNLGSKPQRKSLLGSPKVLDGGVPCTSRTSLSCHAAANLNCVQKGTEATGLGFAETMTVSTTHWPDVVALECSDKLEQKDKSDEEAISDAEHVVDTYRKAGFWAVKHMMDAREWGSLPARWRLYWGALLRPPPDASPQMTLYFFRVLNSFKMSCLSHRQYLTLDDDQRLKESKRLMIPLHSQFGWREPRKVGKEDAGWRLDHKYFYEAMDMRWPPDLTNVGPGIDFSGMLPREREAAFYLNKVFPVTEFDTIQYIDVNPKMGRVLTGCLSADLTEVKRSPWHNQLQTLVGSGKTVLRYQADAESPVVMRVLEGFEYMRLAGWSDELWHINLDSSINEEYRQTVDYLELLSNFAGNAYSIHHYAPWIMSLLATYGYFCCGALGDVLSEVPSGPKREWRQRCMSVQSSSSDSCFEDATCSGFPCQDHSDSS